MRSTRAISLDILVARKQLQALGVELVAARAAERDRIVELAMARKSLPQIARELGMSRNAVAGILWRSGRTISGKRRVRVSRGLDLAGMLDAKLSLALRHRAPQMAEGARS